MISVEEILAVVAERRSADAQRLENELIGELGSGKPEFFGNDRKLPNLIVRDVVAVDLDRSFELAVLDRRSEEHTSELQSLMRISYAVFCLKKKNRKHKNKTHNTRHK